MDTVRKISRGLSRTPAVLSFLLLSFFGLADRARVRLLQESSYCLLGLLFLGAFFSGHLQAQTAATPVISPASGLSYVQFSVTLTDSTSGATIYYTTNGTTPTTSSSHVASGGTVLITQSETLQALAVASGYANSAVASATYTITGQVAAGQYHTVALRSDGSVWGWGYNNYGCVGDGTTTQRYSAVQVSSLSGIVAVAAGAYHSLALTSGGNVYAWGLDSSGQLGNNSTTASPSPVEVLKSNGSGGTTPLTNIVAICAGGYHNLALDSSGNVWAWGLNSNGQLGDGGTTQQNIAEELTTLSGVSVQQLAAGGYHSLLLTTGGAVMSWGLNTSGQLGQGNTTQYNSPTTVSALSGYTISALSAGNTHSVALQSNGTVWAWGLNSSGEVGDGTTTQRNSPVHLTSLSSVTAIAAGYTHTLAISGGTVWSWGTNAVGELGDGTSIERNSPVQALNISGAVLPTAGNEDSQVLKNDGTVWVGGANNCGQTGGGIPALNFNAQQILGLSAPIKQMATGCADSHALALDSSNTVWAWGNNANGELGDGTNYQRVNPVPVSFSGLGSATITSLAANNNRSAALDSNGTVWSWGINPIGNGTTTDASQPVHLSGLSGITALSEGPNGMALDSSGHVWTWGTNTYGQIGDGTTTQRNSPVEVLNYSGGSGTYLSGVTAISGGYDHDLALIGGAVYAWGHNSSMQLGDGTTSNRSLPVPVAGLSGLTIVAISAGYSYSAALDSNGHVWTWGNNAQNELGIGNTNPQTAPVEVTIPSGGFLSNVVSVHCGELSSAALKNDGTVWCWGWNTLGELGMGSLSALYRTVQVVNLSGATSVSTGLLFSLALKQDGSLESWGFDKNGGVGVQSNCASPFAIPGFNALAPPTPTVSITAPANNASVSLGSSQTFTASASETGGTIASVSYYINSTLVGTATTGSYSVNWTPATWGNFTFNAIATDTTGNTSYFSSPITVQVPYVSGPTPVNVTVSLGSTSATINWVDSGNGISNFTVQDSTDGGTTWSTLATVSSSTFSTTATGLTLGTNYQFRVTANYSNSTSATSTSDAAPIIALTTPYGATLVP